MKPIRGDALFWFNLDSSGGYDTRNIHMGCPVVYGNKWIANKWVHWMDQMWNYPCIGKKKLLLILFSLKKLFYFFIFFSYSRNCWQTLH